MSLTEHKANVNGILLLNKPQGITSNGALQKVKRLFKAKKAGHTGSLDPLATGMLPICFGEATKFCHYLLNDDKSYVATGMLGVKTDTGDVLGNIIAKVDKFQVEKYALQEVISHFIGQTMQVPTMFSALKFKGQPLYKLARAGITIERAARPINIHSIELLSFDGQQFTVKVHCGKGTYIRNLVEDIGEQLGVHAHMTQLHRVYVNHFKDKPMYELAELNELTSLESYLIPCEYAVNYLPIITLNEQEEQQLRQGKVINKQDIDIGKEYVRLHTLNQQFIGLGEITELKQLKVKRLLVANISNNSGAS
ncbi:tRNA pseudouridine synthase B [Legionella beliardensis]|uniref:tRNA pseudouridine synthase B n=1 Tax=Legionella beliardensis TaxID=91822 RepID=A0A378I5E3_9GAMM|nr:tRNA pseudouridine(55) synthase TruB [Legionella beliardensis]STX30072.1 tRNA pseudouridine synthase B [Legionella beliardensis]